MSLSVFSNAQVLLVVLALAALTITSHSDETANAEHHEFHNAAKNARSDFHSALSNLSEYLPLSVEYATTVGQHCNIVKYNDRFYTKGGLIISAIMVVFGVIFGFFGKQ